MNDQETSIDNQGTLSAAPDSQSAPAAQQVDLDGLSSWTYQGQEYTPDKFNQIFNEYQNLSRAKETYETNQYYWENFRVDLDKVIRNPSLADEFRRQYPNSFHPILDTVLSSRQGLNTNAQHANPDTQGQNDQSDRLSRLENALKSFQQESYQARVLAESAKIDAILPSLSKKYPLANMDQVLARADAAASREEKLSDSVWERFARESHEASKKLADAYYGAQLKAQMEKGRSGKDTGPGGATPGQPPVRAKTFAEATELAMREIQAKGF